MTITVREAINRGNNLLGVVMLAVTGAGTAERAFGEDDLIDKLDEVAIIALGLAAVVWYFWRLNRFRRSLVPLVLVAAGFVVKVAGLALEFDDPAAAGDDFGIVASLLLIALVEGLLLYRSRPRSEVPDVGA